VDKTNTTSRAALALAATLLTAIFFSASAEAETKFKRIQTQFIAALGDPNATSGTGAQSWGLWRDDPGPRGVRLEDYEQMKSTGGIAPAQWVFDAKDWWLEEHGLIMEKPDFPLPVGQYLVTGDRKVTAVLTIHPIEKDGSQRWDLDKGAKLYDVTHLPCRSARYTSTSKDSAKDNVCSPSAAKQSDYPVQPGAAMPAVNGCNKQDYAVLFVVGVAEGQ
jgi:hypothetical protein